MQSILVCYALLPEGAERPYSPFTYCLDADSAAGFCTPKAVIKIFTTTIMNTSPVARLLRKFSFPCFAGLLRSYFTSKIKGKKSFSYMYYMFNYMYFKIQNKSLHYSCSSRISLTLFAPVILKREVKFCSVSKSAKQKIFNHKEPISFQ